MVNNNFYLEYFAKSSSDNNSKFIEKIKQKIQSSEPNRCFKFDIEDKNNIIYVYAK